MNIRAFLFAVLAVSTCGCSTVEKGKRHTSAPLESYKTAYLVMSSEANWDIGMYIREALTERGVTVTVGNLPSKPKDVSFYVIYVARQNWDMKMYLESLKIQFLDGTTDRLLATGSFKNGFFHSFPDERQKTFEVVESMYNAKYPSATDH
ncbi:MAG TPA: hypothetical protein VFZ59_22065 [Verrucomicrobiae bacterium]|nr:hypothetical protein [Verrucomicrobiae bacterium]